MSDKAPPEQTEPTETERFQCMVPAGFRDALRKLVGRHMAQGEDITQGKLLFQLVKKAAE